MKKKVCVIIPVFNEGEIIIEVIKKMPQYISHIIIVDDCSTDGTSELLEDYIKTLTLNRISLLKMKVNRGVGGATISGFNYASKLGMDTLVKMDGDDQMDPFYIPNLLKPLLEEDFDLVKANRLYSLHGIREMPLIRIFGNIVLSLLTKIASGYWDIMDAQNGFIAINNDAFKKLDAKFLNKRFAFENSLLIEGRIAGFRVKDVNIPARYTNSNSHIRINQFSKDMLNYLLKGLIRRIRKIRVERRKEGSLSYEST